MIEQAAPAQPARSPRLTSIDALRGFDMFWIIGGDDVARAIGAWWGTPAGHRFAEQFEHVEWEGFRFYDLIFPLFLFLVGVVLPFSLKTQQARDQPRRVVFGRIARRVILLFLLGLVYNNALQFRFESVLSPGRSRPSFGTVRIGAPGDRPVDPRMAFAAAPLP
jgi:predicted acyltransferase